MKNVNLTICLGIFTFFCLNFSQAQNTNSQGQGNQQWKINGNIADENHYFGTKNEFSIKFRTNDIERFRITPAGAFGIGTSLPESKLDVNGSVILRESLRLVNLNETAIDLSSQKSAVYFVTCSDGIITKRFKLFKL
jgi:hypothetical protein